MGLGNYQNVDFQKLRNEDYIEFEVFTGDPLFVNSRIIYPHEQAGSPPQCPAQRLYNELLCGH